MTIYRKYRAQSFAEIVGQDHVVQILKQSVFEDKFAHAYLFSGPRGTGKTSMARILAKALNCLNPNEGEPCNECSSCKAINAGRFMDLIEIDAASNRGIDEIRGLKEGISFLPAEGKYKIYIIDEVHMLTEPAFNALLKTLEEPPTQVLFVLATTEPHKLPLTIISRTQRFDFKLADKTNLETKLGRILKSEGLNMSSSALSIIVKAGQGSYRDAETVLEKVISSLSNKDEKKKTIEKEQVERLLGYVDSSTVAEFIEALIESDRIKALDIIHNASAEGANLFQFVKESLEQTRKLMIETVANDGELGKILLIIKELNQASNEIKTSLINILPLEIAILNCTLNFEPKSKPVPDVKKVEKKPIVNNDKVKEVTVKNIINIKEEPEKVVDKKETIKPKVIKEEVAIPEEVLEPKEQEELVENINNNWKEIIGEVKKLNPYLTAIVSSSKFVFNPEEGVVLNVPSAFHKKQLDGVETRKNLNTIIATITGSSVQFKCIIDKTAKTNKAKDSNAKLVEELLS